MHHGSCDLATMKIQKKLEILHFVANEHAAESGNIERCFVPQHDKMEALPRQLRVHLRTKNPAKPCSEPGWMTRRALPRRSHGFAPCRNRDRIVRGACATSAPPGSSSSNHAGPVSAP